MSTEENGKLNIHLGTVDEKGDANVHPAWYYYDPGNNRIMLKRQNRERRHPILVERGMFTFVLTIPVHLIKVHGAKEV